MTDLIIRRADIESDALAIMDGARDFAQRVAFRHLLPDEDEDFIAAVSRVVTFEGMEVTLAEHGEQIVGGIGILYAPFIWNPARLVADELFWWAAQDAPPRTGWRLVDKVMIRIREREAIPMFRKLTTSPPSVERIYRRLGLEPAETMFMAAH